VNKLNIYEQQIADKQLKCWTRYVDLKSMIRKADKDVDKGKFLEFLKGKHYTLTQEQFDEIFEQLNEKG
jgi:hypothetical protein